MIRGSVDIHQPHKMAALLQDLPVLSRPNWELLVAAWQLFPVVGLTDDEDDRADHIVYWHPMAD